MRASKVTVTYVGGSNGNKQQKVTALKNTGGYFVHLTPATPEQHGESRLIIRRKGEPEIKLNGRQISSLKRVLQTA